MAGTAYVQSNCCLVFDAGTGSPKPLPERRLIDETPKYDDRPFPRSSVPSPLPSLWDMACGLRCSLALCADFSGRPQRSGPMPSFPDNGYAFLNPFLGTALDFKSDGPYAYFLRGERIWSWSKGQEDGNRGVPWACSHARLLGVPASLPWPRTIRFTLTGALGKALGRPSRWSWGGPDRPWPRSVIPLASGPLVRLVFLGMNRSQQPQRLLFIGCPTLFGGAALQRILCCRLDSASARGLEAAPGCRPATSGGAAVSQGHDALPPFDRKRSLTTERTRSVGLGETATPSESLAGSSPVLMSLVVL